jgi:uncharacterized membrane protein HdeD (DUF308 family)
LAISRAQDGVTEESSFVTRRTHVNTRTRVFHFQKEQFIEVVTSWRIWPVVVSFVFGIMTIDYSGIFLPAFIIQSFAMKPKCEDQCTDVLLLSILNLLPLIGGAVISYLVAVRSDSQMQRPLYGALSLSLAFVGVLFLGLLPRGAAAYFFGSFSLYAGILSAIPMLITIVTDNALGDTQKGTVSILLGVFGVFLAFLFSSLIQLLIPSETIQLILVGTGVIFSLVVLLGSWFLDRNQNGDIFGRAPGLRRLMNDADEAKAWDIELHDTGFLKTGRLAESYNPQSYEALE